MKTMKIRNILVSAAMTLILCGFLFAQQQGDKFYLPQPNQPFEGKVKTRIGTLEFSNQYPTKQSVETLLDTMDFQGATQAYLWAIPLVASYNNQYFNEEVFKFRQGEMIKYPTLKEKLGILTANATTPLHHRHGRSHQDRAIGSRGT